MKTKTKKERKTKKPARSKIKHIVIQALPHDLYRKLTEEMYDGVYFINTEKKILFWNKEATRITGFTKKEMIGKTCEESPFHHLNKQNERLCGTKRCFHVLTMAFGVPCKNRVYIVKKDRKRIPIDIHTSPVRRGGKLIGIIKIFRDASLYERIERKREQERNRAMRDPLTKIPNRRAVNKRVKIELIRFERYFADLHFALLDVDNFKKINDKYGHNIGDLALKRITHILKYKLRDTDYIGRYGGDEFVVLFPNDSKENTMIALERTRELVEKLKPLNGKIKITISGGVTKVRPGDDMKSLVKRADKALYRAKKKGRNKIEYM